MCAGVYSKLKAFNVKRWPTYTADVGFSTIQPCALKREIHLMMSWVAKKKNAARERTEYEGDGGNLPQIFFLTQILILTLSFWACFGTHDLWNCFSNLFRLF